MMRRNALSILLVASLGAFSATALAQQYNTPPSTPVGSQPAPSPGTGTAMPSNGATSGTTGSMGTTGSGMKGAAMGSGIPRDMTGYRSARSACDSGPAASKAQCITTLNTRYSSVDSKCQKLSASALDDCLKGADHGQ